VSLADGDINAAVEYGSTADREATELGVEREVPLIRAVLARSLLANDDLRGAARTAAAVLEATQGMSLSFPFAIGLETAALVLHAAGAADEGQLGELLAAAARIRRAGDRPAPATLDPAVTGLRTSLGREAAAADPGLTAAVSSARTLLARAASSSHTAQSTPAR
jgi:hypothetical protein